jgi:hypothetical protein
MSDDSSSKVRSELAACAEGRQVGTARELWQLLAREKKWWLVPILLLLLLLAALVFLSGTAVAPFIYTLF